MHRTVLWADAILGVGGRAPVAPRLYLEGLEDRTVPGFLAPVDYAVAQNPVAVATGDFNGDGRLDLVTLSSIGRTVSLLLNNGEGTFQAARTFSTAPGGTNWSPDSA